MNLVLTAVIKAVITLGAIYFATDYAEQYRGCRSDKGRKRPAFMFLVCVVLAVAAFSGCTPTPVVKSPNFGSTVDLPVPQSTVTAPDPLVRWWPAYLVDANGAPVMWGQGSVGANHGVYLFRGYNTAEGTRTTISQSFRMIGGYR